MEGHGNGCRECTSSGIDTMLGPTRQGLNWTRRRELRSTEGGKCRNGLSGILDMPCQWHLRVVIPFDKYRRYARDWSCLMISLTHTPNIFHKIICPPISSKIKFSLLRPNCFWFPLLRGEIVTMGMSALVEMWQSELTKLGWKAEEREELQDEAGRPSGDDHVGDHHHLAYWPIRSPVTAAQVDDRRTGFWRFRQCVYICVWMSNAFHMYKNVTLWVQTVCVYNNKSRAGLVLFFLLEVHLAITDVRMLINMAKTVHLRQNSEVCSQGHLEIGSN